MRDLSTDKYSHEEVYRAFHAADGSRRIAFRYDLLNKEEQKIAELTNVVSGEVSFSAFNTIKRTASFRLKEEVYRRVAYMTWQEFGKLDWSDLDG